MFIAGTLSFLTLSLLSGNGDPNGPYVDSQGRIWKTLPQLEDYDVAVWDAEVATDVYTDRNGRRFQICRQMTPEEEAAAGGAQGFLEQLQPDSGPGAGIRATVYVNCPGDEEYRSYFGSSWQSHINTVVESADNSLYSNWGINFIVGAYCTWDSNDAASINGLLDEAYAECGYGGQEYMAAFSNDPTSGGAVGIAYIGWPRQLTKRYLSYENVICQHEAGHTYTCYHCCISSCVMQPTVAPNAFGNFHNSSDGCSGQNHRTVMSNQRNRY
ncbi:MAG: hypothetical protein EYC70_10595 [Planctomycetota bacterium]|nr:MAG: hypothetical protein EYC70_10595 [Planctomycetota bacterium]